MKLEELLKTEGLEIGQEPITISWHQSAGWVLHGWESMQIRDWDSVGIEWFFMDGYQYGYSSHKMPVFQRIDKAILFMVNNSYMFDSVKGE